MIKEDKFWRLAHKYRRYFINGFSDSIDLSNYNDEFWSLFVDNFFNVCTGNNYLCIKLIYYCKEVLPKDVLNGLFFLCLIPYDSLKKF